MSPVKRLLIDAVKGRNIPITMAAQWEKDGLVVSTGNQWNERWEWSEKALQALPLELLDGLYGYLVTLEATLDQAQT